jgi:DNA uptake protein ComE-like DNA-binding protein
MSLARGLWTLSQRRGLVALLTIIVVILAIRLAMNPLTIGQNPPASGPAADQLADRIDPNTASAAELAAIPSLGEVRAGEIVEYRQRFLADHPGELAFAKPPDLERVPGIGTATSEMLEPYLIFTKNPVTGR